MNPEDLSAQQRSALIVWLMLEGGEYTTSEASSILGLTYWGAYFLLHEIKEAVPGLQSPQEPGGKWFISEGTI